MRATLLAALALATSSPARADAPEPTKIASRWLDAAQAGDKKQLIALSAPALRVESLHLSVQLFCDRAIVTRDAVSRRVRELKGQFATATWKAMRESIDMFVCQTVPRHPRPPPTMPLPRKPGDSDVLYDGGLGVTITVRVSTAGRVVLVRVLINQGDQ